jgi:hypothetical protein
VPTGAAAAPIEEEDQDAGPASAPPPPRPSDEAINLGSTVLPALVRSYWKPALAGLLVLVVLVWIIRRMS